MVRAWWFVVFVAGCGRLDFDPVDRGPPLPDSAPIALTVASAQTASPVFTPLDGAVMTLAAVPGYSWILVASAALESSSLATDEGAEIDYLVDGVQSGLGGTQQAAVGKPGPWQSIFLVGERAATVQFEARDAAGGTTTVHELHAIAFLLPTADVTYVSRDGDTLVDTTDYQPTITFSLPGVHGDHVILALANAAETLDSRDVFTQWLDTSGAPHLTDLQNPRQVFQSSLAIWREDITAPAPTITLEGRAVVTPSVFNNVRVLAIPASALASLDFAFEPAELSNDSVTPRTIQTLDVAPSSADTFVYLATSRINENCDTVAGERRVHFALDGQDVAAIDHLSDNCAEQSTYGTVGLAPPPPFTLTTTIATAGSTTVYAREAATVVLGLRLPR